MYYMLYAIYSRLYIIYHTRAMMLANFEIPPRAWAEGRMALAAALVGTWAENWPSTV